MRLSSLPSSLRYDAASCFDAARSARPPQQGCYGGWTERAPSVTLPFVNIVGADNQRNNGFAVEVKQQAQITFNLNGVNRAPVIC